MKPPSKNEQHPSSLFYQYYLMQCLLPRRVKLAAALDNMVVSREYCVLLSSYMAPLDTEVIMIGSLSGKIQRIFSAPLKMTPLDY